MANNFQVTAGVGTTIATHEIGGAHTQRVASDHCFALEALAGKGYGSSVAQIIAPTTEFDWILYKNTSASALIRLWEQTVSIPQSASSVRSVLRIYKNPTITLNGTAAGVGGLRNGQAASVMNAFTGPTIAVRGTLVQCYGITNVPVLRLLYGTRFIEPLDSILVTMQCSTATELHAFNMAWLES